MDDRVEISALAESLRVADRIMGLNPGLIVSHPRPELRRVRRLGRRPAYGTSPTDPPGDGARTASPQYQLGLELCIDTKDEDER